jgi:hypothetical protein
VHLHSQGTLAVIVLVFIFAVSINLALSGSESPIVCGFWRRLVVGWGSFCLKWWGFRSPLSQVFSCLLFMVGFWLLYQSCNCRSALSLYFFIPVSQYTLCSQTFFYLISVPYSGCTLQTSSVSHETFISWSELLFFHRCSAFVEAEGGEQPCRDPWFGFILRTPVSLCWVVIVTLVKLNVGVWDAEDPCFPLPRDWAWQHLSLLSFGVVLSFGGTGGFLTLTLLLSVTLTYCCFICPLFHWRQWLVSWS